MGLALPSRLSVSEGSPTVMMIRDKLTARGQGIPVPGRLKIRS
jgi:hypothetical protein